MTSDAVVRDRCKFCARELAVIPLTPAEMDPHCTSRGCRWCSECYAGQTSVSPVRRIAT